MGFSCTSRGSYRWTSHSQNKWNIPSGATPRTCVAAYVLVLSATSEKSHAHCMCVYCGLERLILWHTQWQHVAPRSRRLPRGPPPRVFPPHFLWMAHSPARFSSATKQVMLYVWKRKTLVSLKEEFEKTWQINRAYIISSAKPTTRSRARTSSISIYLEQVF